MLCFIQPTGQSGVYMVVPIGGDRPDQGLPGHGHPDQGLPGYGHPDQGLPGSGAHPGNRPPGSIGGRPDQGLPGSGAHPGNRPPGSGGPGHPSQGLPVIPGVPDNSLPDTAPPTVSAGSTLIMIRKDGVWHWAALPAGVTLPQPLPPAPAPKS